MRLRTLVPLCWLVGLHVAVVGAGFFSPHEPTQQNRSLPYAPPTPIHVVDPEGHWHWRPFVCQQSISSPGVGTEDCARRSIIHFLVAGAPYRIGWISLRLRLIGVDAPAELHLMGTDAYGRDQFSRFLYGGQVSLIGSLIACSVSLAMAMLLGMAAGFYGKRIDDAIMGLAELFLALPWLYALFAVRAFLPLDMDPSVAFWFLSVAIGVIGWARPARLIRGEVLSAKEREYVLAARGFGAGDIYLLRWHLLPQVKGIVLTQASLLLPRYILAEVTMSFLGLGISEPRASWGNMLGALQQYNVLTSYWWIFLPAVGLIPTFLAYLAISDVLRMKP